MRMIFSVFILIISFFHTVAQQTGTDITRGNVTAGVNSQIPKYPDIFYEYRIAELNRKTPVELDYNETVRKYIEIYSIKRRDEFAKTIGLAQLYFPYFDEILAKYNLPLELKYLTIVESDLNPLAVSKSGAVGIWQFLLNTCRLFDLHVDSYIDERRIYINQRKLHVNTFSIFIIHLTTGNCIIFIQWWSGRSKKGY